ncbi:MAG: M24 family metallopeptidase [Terriglobia bacterium]
MTPWHKRLRRLRQRLRDASLGALLVSHLPNVLYLTNFHGSTALLVVTSRRAVLFTDGRYCTQARREVRGAQVLVTTGSLLAAAAEWLRSERPEQVGFEAPRLAFAACQQLRKAFKTPTRLIPTANLVEGLRARKDATEIASIRRAVCLSSQVFAEVLPLIRPGVRELDLAAEIEYRMKRSGASAPAFETIVASGPRAAWPHARASSKRLAKNELVVLDLGAILKDYCSDMSRTVYLGKPSARIRRFYAAVREAQQRAFDAVRPGVPARQVDAAARQTLKTYGVDRYVIHGTGHGLGLEIHEEPRLGHGVGTRLATGHVVTLEPGVYVPGWGGIRIEDVVVVRPGGAERLTPTPHGLIAL